MPVVSNIPVKLALILAFAASCDRAPSVPNGAPLSISAVDLGAAYADDESKTQRDYGNRRLLVTGMVTGVTSDFEDNEVVRMKGPTNLIDVHLTLAKEARSQAQTIRKGSVVTLRCEGATLVIGSPTLDGCALQPDPIGKTADPNSDQTAEGTSG